MAEWNKGKVLPSAINGGQEFTKKDNLAINELNAIVNNSFYASEKAENAERLVEEALSGNIDLDNYYTKDETYSKEEVKNLIDNIEVSGESSVVVDSELDAESENPVQNKVITQALDNRYTKDETYSQQQVDDLISGIETGGGTGTSVTVDSELNAESENPVQNKVLYDPVTFAESERQKSETDGAIVHEKDIADVEHIETIYDKSSSDSNINWGYTNGINYQSGDVISKNLSGVFVGLKGVRVQACFFEWATTTTLTQTYDNKYWVTLSIGRTAQHNNVETFMTVSIGENGLSNIQNFSRENNTTVAYNSGSWNNNFKVTKIEGVY